MIQKITRTRARLRPRRASHAGERVHVHFHRGPQGQPAPCYDARCSIPRLSVQA
jgi:hypothetical protein